MADECLDDDFYNSNLLESEKGLSYDNVTASTTPYYKRPEGASSGREDNLEGLTNELENIYNPDEQMQDDVIESEARCEIDEIEPNSESINHDPIQNANQLALLIYLTTHTESLSLRTRQRSRSNKRKLKNPLLAFYDNPNSSMKNAKDKNSQKKKERDYPKKEYYRVKCIRKWKKYLRKLNKNQDFFQMENFKKNYKQHKSELDEAALTEKGPKTEAKSRRTEKSDFNSFNNEYVKKLFEKPSSKMSFKLFIIDYFEAKKKCGSESSKDSKNSNSIEEWCTALCQTFKFDCCKPLIHQEDCEKKWAELINYTHTGLILNNEPQL